MRQDEPNFFPPKLVPCHAFWAPFCVEFVFSRCGVHFSGSRRSISSRIRRGREFRPHRVAMRNLCRQFAPILRQSLARWFGRYFGPNFNPRDFPENRRSVPSEVVGCFLCILLYRFLQRRPSIKISASSFVRFSEISFCRKLIRAGILRRVAAVLLSVSLLATTTPVLRRFHCVGHATAKPREHRLATDAFSIPFEQEFLHPESRVYRPEATRTQACYRRIFNYLD